MKTYRVSWKKGRRMGVALAKGENIKEAQLKADKAAASIKIISRCWCCGQ